MRAMIEVWPGSPTPLGAHWDGAGTNFALYSENATRVELMLFDDPEVTRPTRTYEMTRYGDVWNVYVEGVGLGQHYGFEPEQTVPLFEGAGLRCIAREPFQLGLNSFFAFKKP